MTEMVVITKRAVIVAASLLVGLGAIACAGNPWQASPDQPAAPAPGGSPVSSTPGAPAAVPGQAPGLAPGPTRTLPLDDLSPPAAAVAQARGLSVAVLVPGTDTAWGHDAARPVDLASVTKLLVMLEAFDRRERQGRPLLDEERILLDRIIRESDNESASTLWAALGGRAALVDVLARRNIDGFTPDAAGHWGLTGGSPEALSRFLVRLAQGDLATPEHTRFALDLMTRVIPAQRFGVGEVVDARLGDLGTVAVKNGWLQQESGWLIISSALLLDPQGRPLAAVVVSGSRFPTLPAGVEALNEVTRALAQPLRDTITRQPGGTG